MSFNSLEQVANRLVVNSKTSVEPRQGLAAALDGSRQTMRYIVDHCVQEVLVLEKVIGALKAVDKRWPLPVPFRDRLAFWYVA